MQLHAVALGRMMGLFMTTRWEIIPPPGRRINHRNRDGRPTQELAGTDPRTEFAQIRSLKDFRLATGAAAPLSLKGELWRDGTRNSASKLGVLQVIRPWVKAQGRFTTRFMTTVGL